MDETNNLKPFAFRHCPVCNSDQILRGSEISSNPKAETLRFDELIPYWNGFFKKKVFFTYYRCQKCKILFCRQFLNPSQLVDLYSQMPDNTAGVSVQALKKTQRGYFEALKQYSSLTGEYLEIGPDIGLFTEYCVKEGKFDKFWLFEPNQCVHNDLEQLLTNRKNTISLGMFNYDNIPEKQISTVAMIHVLDHFLDPKGTLIKLREKITNSAILLFVTHDESSLLSKITKSKWPPYCLQHPQLFNPVSIEALLNTTGFKVIDIIKSYNYIPIFYLFKHLLWCMGMHKIHIPNVNAPSLPIKLGNIITMATIV